MKRIAKSNKKELLANTPSLVANTSLLLATSKRHRIQVLANTEPNLSAREIGRRVGASHVYVSEVLANTDLYTQILKLMRQRTWTDSELDAFLDKLWDSLVAKP
jgi:hypothetical protein